MSLQMGVMHEPLGLAHHSGCVDGTARDQGNARVNSGSIKNDTISRGSMLSVVKLRLTTGKKKVALRGKMEFSTSGPNVRWARAGE